MANVRAMPPKLGFGGCLQSPTQFAHTTTALGARYRCVELDDTDKVGEEELSTPRVLAEAGCWHVES